MLKRVGFFTITQLLSLVFFFQRTVLIEPQEHPVIIVQKALKRESIDRMSAGRVTKLTELVGIEKR